MNDKSMRQAALVHYHAHYDNEAYTALRKLIEWEFHGNDRAQNRIMNLIIDECLRMSGWWDAHHVRQHHLLMIVLRAYPHLKQPVLAYVRQFQ